MSWKVHIHTHTVFSQFNQCHIAIFDLDSFDSEKWGIDHIKRKTILQRSETPIESEAMNILWTFEYHKQIFKFDKVS